jgi:demethylmenaquinone methyltransferase/2-methoxy-6-polyprenyl-1,4-benzoquinol methylase
MTNNTTYQAQEIQSIFNNIAPVYDQLNDQLSLGLHKIWKKMTVKWCEPQANYIGLDLCCGSGDLTFLLAQNLTHGVVYGVDFSPELLTIARQKNQQKSLTCEINWVEGDVLNLPFEDNFFDCATMGYGLRNVVNISRCLQELYRVMKPQAKAAILDFHRPENSLLNNWQKWYLNNIVVPTAAKLGVKDEYAYINPSLDRFPTGREQVKLAQDVGFRQVVHYPIFGGTMGVLVITKM